MFPIDSASLLQQTHRVRAGGDRPLSAGCSLCSLATDVEFPGETEVIDRESLFDGLLARELPKVAALDQSGVLRFALLEVLGGEGLLGLLGCGLAGPTGNSVPLSLMYCERLESDEPESDLAEKPG